MHKFFTLQSIACLALGAAILAGCATFPEKQEKATSPLTAGYVHELRLKNLTNQTDIPLLHEEVYYTLVHIPENLTL